MAELFPQTPPPQALHPECVKMHKIGMYVCTMVDCGYCDTRHPPHKACKEEKPDDTGPLE